MEWQQQLRRLHDPRANGTSAKVGLWEDVTLEFHYNCKSYTYTHKLLHYTLSTAFSVNVLFCRFSLEPARCVIVREEKTMLK